MTTPIACMREFARQGDKLAPLLHIARVSLDVLTGCAYAVHTPRQPSATGHPALELHEIPRKGPPAVMVMMSMNQSSLSHCQLGICGRFSREAASHSRADHVTVIPLEREDWALSAADDLVGRGSEQRQIYGTTPPDTDHDYIDVPIGGHSKDFLIRFADDDRLVNGTTGRLVLAREFM